MRKIIVTFGLILMCIAYFVLIKMDITGKDIENKVNTLITNEKNELIQTYPSSPEGVIDSHNRLMQYEYNKELRNEDIPVLIETMRMLYSDKLVANNLLEIQEISLTQEIASNREKELYMTGSKVGDVIYKEEDKVTAIVQHFTTLGGVRRTYHLIKENDRWKINSWEDQSVE